ncbi:YczE/YyaS/YitT family protein [Faecalicatena contorta]|uniref:YczE/YyaS/YitT family protein n=1 Tax=Faecalicatena contorta TaxID=39482 RepID=UPI001F2D1C74|nr:DUF6198 family protein [Faecalicatena contorta]MCF2554921.1 hypothetical protein [Faecalicatena contorta]
MKRKNINRGLFYIIGLLVLALGIILNTKAGLGVSPIISVAYSVSVIIDANFGNMTLLLYSSFILIEMLLHTRAHYLKKKRTSDGVESSLKLLLLKDALQFPLSLGFTRFMNLFSDAIPAYDTPGVSVFYSSFPGRIIVLIFAIILTGIGAAVSLNMRLIPNPGDGIVQAIADCIGKTVGFTKNCFDLFCILTTIIVGTVFAGHMIGIGIGTVLAVIGVGRVIAVFNHFFKKEMAISAGVENWG